MNRRIRKKLFDQSRSVWYLNNPKLWKQLLLEFGDEKDKWICTLKVGDIIEDCRCKHLAIKHILQEPYDCTLVLEDNAQCSAKYCCDPIGEKE